RPGDGVHLAVRVRPHEDALREVTRGIRDLARKRHVVLVVHGGPGASMRVAVRPVVWGVGPVQVSDDDLAGLPDPEEIARMDVRVALLLGIRAKRDVAGRIYPHG